MQELEGRVAVITGGGSGIGEGLATACGAAGMRVVVSDIEEAQAERVAAELRDRGSEAIAVRTDVSEASSVEELAARSYDAFGAVHLLCNNAGVMALSALVEAPQHDWEWTLSVNLYGQVHGIRAFVPRMRAQGEPAHIVNTASIAGVVPLARELGVYTASKYASVGISEMLRAELEPDGIGVSVVCPGSVETGIFRAERNRPQEFGGSVTDDSGEDPGVAPGRMSAVEAAERILDGVRANRMYIFTHPELREQVQERFERMLADFDAVS